VCIPHFFENPLYLISYVISNDAALQLYQMELSEQGSGIVWFEENLASAQPYFLAFVEEAGLESPFATGRLIRVRQTLEEVLQ
jgi:oligoendopeptidase F